MAPPDLTTVQGTTTEGLGEVTTERTGYVLFTETHGRKDTTPWNAYFVRDGGANKTLEIKDQHGRVVYKILPHGMGEATNHNFRENSLGRMQMHIVHADGSKACVLRRDMFIGGSSGRDIASEGTYTLYAYSPSFAGQTSANTDRDGEALYLYAWLPDPEVGMPAANNEATPALMVRRFLSSNDKESASCVLRYTRLEMSPFRMLVKEGPPPQGEAAHVAPTAPYHPHVVATVAADKYLMSISAGRGVDGKYFDWDREFDQKGKRNAQWGVDCAAGVDSLLIIVIAITAGANGLGDARGSIGAATLW